MPGSRAPQEARRQQILDAAYEVALNDGISGVTLRTVAARAGLSHGLVVFHFKEKDQLIAAILERVLAENDLRQRTAAAARSPVDRMSVTSHIRAEMTGLTHDPRWLRLFLEYWALGVRDRRIRTNMRLALRRYRETFRRHVTAPDDRGAASATIEPDAFAGIAVSLVSGFALQATIGHNHVDPDGYARIVETLMSSGVRSGMNSAPDGAGGTAGLVRRQPPRR